MLAPAGTSRAAERIDVSEARLELIDGNWKVRATFEFDLPPVLEDAVNKGIALYFVVEFEATRSRWYWFDEKAISAAQSYRLIYQPLTRQYRVSSGGGLQQHFATLKEALAVIRIVRGWTVADKNALKYGETYQTALRMRLDVSQLPKPFQINAVNSRDWNLSSDWRYATFTVGDR